MQTGESPHDLRKITDMTRKISIMLLAVHCYFYLYTAFYQWHLTHPIVEKILLIMADTALFRSFNLSKGAALGLLVISLLGTKGRKNEKLSGKPVVINLLMGLMLYWGSVWTLDFQIPVSSRAILYMTVTGSGYLLLLHGGAQLSRFITGKLKKDTFNTLQETFPQEERLLSNPFSINLPAIYNLKGKQRKSWINIINPFRGILVAGTPGSGKSYFVIRHIITQHICKGFTMFIYDFKFDDLSTLAYNTYLKYREQYPTTPRFYVINFDDLSFTHRCNPLDPQLMTDITDAAESARTIMLGLNRDWIKRRGDFFVESPISFLTAIIWFLRKYKDGTYCTLPHVIELMQTEYDKLFSILKLEPEISFLINPFISAYQNGATKQLEGQIGSAKIGMATLSSPKLYYVLSGNDFTLDINNPKDPKIVCIGNNYQQQDVYGAVISLYASRMIRLVNRKDQLKSSLVFDEFPTIYFNGIDALATGRSNQVAITVGVQDFSQLQRDYGKQQSDVIVNIVGNIISGQVKGETARQLSESFGRIQQDKESLSFHSSDTSISRSTQLDAAIPASKIARLSSGEMVGIVSDNPDEEIELKMFHCKIQNNHKALKAEQAKYRPIPQIREVTDQTIQENYHRIKKEVTDIVDTEYARIESSEELCSLLVIKNESIS